MRCAPCLRWSASKCGCLANSAGLPPSVAGLRTAPVCLQVWLACQQRRSASKCGWLANSAGLPPSVAGLRTAMVCLEVWLACEQRRSASKCGWLANSAGLRRYASTCPLRPCRQEVLLVAVEHAFIVKPVQAQREGPATRAGKAGRHGGVCPYSLPERRGGRSGFAVVDAFSRRPAATQAPRAQLVCNPSENRKDYNHQYCTEAINNPAADCNCAGAAAGARRGSGGRRPSPQLWQSGVDQQQSWFARSAGIVAPSRSAA
eukprot:365576-Chlamydomonas_euryale.AAC.13